MAGKKRFLTEVNKRRIHGFLRSYLLEVFSGEEYITGFKEAYNEAERVELYGGREYLTPSLVSEWLRGLPLDIAYMTYDIVCMLFGAVTGLKDYRQLDGVAEEDYDIDSFYWRELGRIIYDEGGGQ